MLKDSIKNFKDYFLKNRIMAFTQFKFLKDVLKAYQLRLSKKNFIEPTLDCTAPTSLHTDITFSLNQDLYKHSEAAICEQLILRKVGDNVLPRWLRHNTQITTRK